MHLNDTSDEVTMDVKYLSAKEVASITDGNYSYLKFEKDVAGRVLRYKVCVFDMKIHSVLYNTGSSIESVPFKEMRVKPDTLIELKSSN